MRSPYFKSVNSPADPFLRRLLSKWIGVNEELARSLKWKDCGWWNNERASVSALAGAAWCLGGTAIEEYSENKPWRRGQYQGQVDLYLSIGSKRLIMEAKQSWPSCSSRAGSPAGDIDELLDEACAEVRKVRAGGAKRFGAVFAAPYLPKRQRPHVDARLHEWIGYLNSVPCSASAWLFPPEMRQLIASDRYLYPGVAVFLRSARN